MTNAGGRPLQRWVGLIAQLDPEAKTEPIIDDGRNICEKQLRAHEGRTLNW